MKRPIGKITACSVVVFLVMAVPTLWGVAVEAQVELAPPQWLPEEKWDSMERILNELRSIITGERANPGLVKKAAEQLWLAHHMSGLAELPTPGVQETFEAHKMHVQQLEQSVKAIEGALKRQDLQEDALSLLLEVKVNLEAEIDWVQTIGKWTATVPPNSPAAKLLAKKQIRAPFLPLSFPRMPQPQEDIRSEVIGQGECMVVVKEIHGLKARLVAEVKPVWAEPWYARRRIVGYQVVWWVEYVPAELIKTIVTCNKDLRIQTNIYTQIKEEPELLNFWQFYRKDP